MIVRHVVEASNVDADGYVADPTLACHGVIEHGRLSELSGPIDPVTHLNRDFPDHTLGDCVVVESLRPGARVLPDSERPFRLVPTRRKASTHLGHVDVDARRLAWLEVHRQHRERSSHAHR